MKKLIFLFFVLIFCMLSLKPKSKKTCGRVYEYAYNAATNEATISIVTPENDSLSHRIDIESKDKSFQFLKNISLTGNIYCIPEPLTFKN